MLFHGCDITNQIRTESVNVLTSIGYARFLGSNPQQTGIVHIHALDADIILNPLFLIDVTRLNSFVFVSVGVKADES